MSPVGVLLTGLVVSYLGSIPPGSLNLTVIQLGIREQHKAALNFAIASALVEFFYAGLAVKAQIILSAHQAMADYFELITGGLLLTLGLINLGAHRRSTTSRKADTSAKGGFWRGFVLSCLNPMAIPFWIAVTAALETSGWLFITDRNLIFYLLGISAGTLLLLLQASWLGIRLRHLHQRTLLMYQLPGIILMSLGAFTLYKWAL